MEEDLKVYVPRKHKKRIMARFDYNICLRMGNNIMKDIIVDINVIPIPCPLCVEFILKDGSCTFCPFGEWARRVGIYEKCDNYYCTIWIKKILPEKCYFELGMIDVTWHPENHKEVVKQLRRLREAIKKYIMFVD